LKNIIRLISFLLAAVMFLSLSSCKKAQDGNASNEKPLEATTASTRALRLLYSASDTLNPYTAQTDLNRKLSLLIFDPLVRLNNDFEPQYIIADSVVLENGLCTVKLKNVYFTDGTPLTADDVVYSFNTAKGSASEYAYQLYEVQSATAVDSSTVSFKLDRNDIYFERLLVFPIIKSGSDKTTDVDGRQITPIGSGRYIPNAEGDKLVANKDYSYGKINVGEISLINAPDGEAVSHYVEIGAVDMYYTDTADLNIVRMSGKKSTVNMNSLVYIGINHSYGQLGSRELRHAISSALDRAAVCKEAYHNNAVAATGFYNPAIKLTEAVQNIQTSANTQISIENLEEIGYNGLDNSGMRINSSGNRIRLTLMVNGENAARVAAAKLVARQLSQVGIEITVIERSFAEYSAALASGSFQLYLGEVKTLANMDLAPLTVAGGSCAYGLVAAEPSAEETTEEKPAEDGTAATASIADIINGFYSGANTITDIAVALQTELPVIPLCFRQGLLFCGEDVANVGEASESDIYFSIGDYTVKK